MVHDRHRQKLRKLQRAFGVEVQSDLRRALAGTAMLVMAVRPSSVAELLADVRRSEAIRQGRRAMRIGVSLVAGVPISYINSCMKGGFYWTRAMPSPACSTGHGTTAVAFGRGFPAAAKVRVRSLFECMGPVLEVPESKFDAFTAVYSVSHGYHALAALAAAGVKCGLDRRTAEKAAAHALADGICSWRESAASLKELLEEAATPGGIAAEVIATADAAGYTRIVEKAVRAGVRRARGYGRDGSR